MKLIWYNQEYRVRQLYRATVVSDEDAKHGNHRAECILKMAIAWDKQQAWISGIWMTSKGHRNWTLS